MFWTAEFEMDRFILISYLSPLKRFCLMAVHLHASESSQPGAEQRKADGEVLWCVSRRLVDHAGFEEGNQGERH